MPMPCPCCHGPGWVCVLHPDNPWPHSHLENLDAPDGECAGPGIPCTCEMGIALAIEIDVSIRP